jgi:hypothetical protein
MAVSEDEKKAEQAMSTARITNSTQTGISLKEMVSHLFMGCLFYVLEFQVPSSRFQVPGSRFQDPSKVKTWNLELGSDFSQQNPFNPFVADFFC